MVDGESEDCEFRGGVVGRREEKESFAPHPKRGIDGHLGTGTDVVSATLVQTGTDIASATLIHCGVTGMAGLLGLRVC